MKKKNNEDEKLYNAKNDRIKYDYRIHKKRALKRDHKTIIDELKHIRKFEIFIKFKNIEIFDQNIADQYINWLFRENLSLSFINDNLRILKEFLKWLERQRGYKSKIDYNHIDYLNISNNQRKMAKAKEYQESYTYQEIIKTIRQMPENSNIAKRNKAIISLQALASLRPSELRTVKMKNLRNINDKYFIDVNPKNMEVKFAKQRKADFMPLPKDISQNLLNWYKFLKEINFKNADPLFPIIPNNFNQNNLFEENIKFTGIKANSSICNIFKKAFTNAGFEYINPHNFRHTAIRFAETQSPAFLNAVRQSLGHSSIETSFNSYGTLSEYDQRERINGLEYDFEKE
jgi:integrase